MDVASVYCDGGVIGRNPSSHGGTWAWLWLDADQNILRRDSGVIYPGEIGLPTVTNNLTELVAAVRAMEGLPDRWCGLIYTDSQVTLYRITHSKKFAGIPDPWRARCLHHRSRLCHCVVLLGGHPTKAELASGVRKDGLPVSQWNVWCDKECGRLSQLARETVGG